MRCCSCRHAVARAPNREASVSLPKPRKDRRPGSFRRGSRVAWCRTYCWRLGRRAGTRSRDSCTRWGGPRPPATSRASPARPVSNASPGAREVVAMTVKSRRGVLVGAFIALVVPISYLVVALLVENGIAPYDQTHDLFLGPLSVLGWISLFLLGPIGIVVAVRAAGLGRGSGSQRRGASRWSPRRR